MFRLKMLPHLKRQSIFSAPLYMGSENRARGRGARSVTLADKPWGGVFDQPTDRRVEKFTESVSFDRRLYAHDIRGSIAHAHMLSKAGVISDDERHQIVTTLEEIGREIA